jgi:hypothetical protein
MKLKKPSWISGINVKQKMLQPFVLTESTLMAVATLNKENAKSYKKGQRKKTHEFYLFQINLNIFFSL